jgi:hypothetical protein
VYGTTSQEKKILFGSEVNCKIAILKWYQKGGTTEGYQCGYHMKVVLLGPSSVLEFFNSFY